MRSERVVLVCRKHKNKNIEFKKIKCPSKCLHGMNKAGHNEALAQLAMLLILNIV